MGACVIVMYKHLAYLLRKESFNTVIAWIPYHLCFSLLRFAVMCLRGARLQHHTLQCESINLATLEGKIPSLPFSPIDTSHPCITSHTHLLCIICISWLLQQKNHIHFNDNNTIKNNTQQHTYINSRATTDNHQQFH